MLQRFRTSARWFIPVVAGLLLLGLLLSRVLDLETDDHQEPEIEISAEEAGQHIGSPAKVCGQVASTNHLPDVKGQPAFLNFGRLYPDQVFTAVIFGENRSRFQSAPEILYRERAICVSGTIRRHEGQAQIVVSRPSQITPAE